jgi:pilus assembly protein CpaC
MRQNTTHHKASRSGARKLMLATLVCTSAMSWTIVRADAPETAAPAATQPAEPAPQPALVARGLDDNGTNVITMTTGQSRLLSLSVPAKAIDVTQPDFVSAKVVSPTEIVLTARKPGTTDLVIWDDRGRSQTIEITVAADLKALRAELDKVLPTAKVELSSAAADIVIRGRVADAQLADKVLSVATSYGKVINLMDIAGGQQVTLQVRFAEVSRSATLNLGFNAFANGGTTKFGWNNGPGDTPLGGLATNAETIDSSVSLFGAGKSGAFAFEFFVEALAQNNLLRVLAEPNLTVISGNQANFLAGGEFPVPVPQPGAGGTAITIDYKKYGVRLTFTPIVMGDGRIRLEVSPEVSQLDPNHSVAIGGYNIPALTTRSATTTVELNEGQTLALAGLLNNQVSAVSNVTPLLGDLPVLGTLFRSVRYERDETELVVLVTPRLSAGMNPGQVPEYPGQMWRYPTPEELFWKADLGGPVADTAHAPAVGAPRQFHGPYGFTPAGDGNGHGAK